MLIKNHFKERQPNYNWIRYKQYRKLARMHPKRKDLWEKAEFYYRKASKLSFDELAR